MATKKCVVYETLNSLQDLQIVESANNEVRLSGVFGVTGVKNNNNRIYSKDNYAQMVESLQKVIATEGCPGELEHPNTMNITLENVSHKIESIEMNEDGTITGTILLLNTPKGQIAKAIVEGGLPLYISSRGAGSIDESGHVTLSTIKTYDLVGTPGFSQAKLTLKENQTLECLNESLEDGNLIYAIVEDDESDDLLDDEEKQKKDDASSKDNDEEIDSDNDNSSDDDKDNKEDDEDEENNKDIDKEPTMKDLKKSIDELTDKVTNLEAELHIAKESLENVKPVNYDAIEAWIKEEFAPEHTSEVMESVNESIEEATKNIANGVQNWVCEEFAPEVQNWVCEEFAPEVQNWVCEEFAPEVQNWVCEEFAPEVQNWICEEFAPEVEGWICEEFAPEVEGWITEEFTPTVEQWINEEFAPEHKNNIVAEVNKNVSEFMEAQKATKLSEIDNLLESIDSQNTDEALETLKESYKVTDEKYKGIYVVENMPAEYRPIWEGLDEQKKGEIIRQSKMYDFTKQGVLESFWDSVDMNPTQPINENKNEISSYHKNIFSQMMKLRRF